MISGISETSPDTARLPEAFASVRFVGSDLQPDDLSSLLGLKPTVAYAKGDHFEAGERRSPQLRRFGLWLFSTEHLVASKHLCDHERALLLCLTARRPRQLLRRFAEQTELQSIVSLYWYGPTDAQVPIVNSRLARFADDIGAKIETDFEVETLDDQAA